MKLLTMLFVVLSLLHTVFVDMEVDTVTETAGSFETASVVRVVDGDTIVVLLQGKQETVRYIGIDTPEPYRDAEPACFSKEATVRNKELLNNNEVRLVAGRENTDRYDRLLRYVYVGNEFINEILVAEGFAKSLTIAPNTTYAQQFKQLEKEAREQKIGLWGECVEEF